VCHTRPLSAHPIHTQPNAWLTPLGREWLLGRHIDHVESLDSLAAQAGISVRSAYKWLARYCSGVGAALVARRSNRRSQRRTVDPLQLQSAVDHHHERCTLRRIARVVAAPISTLGRVIKAMGLGRLKNLQPAEPGTPLPVGTAQQHDPRRDQTAGTL
jgi:hypothetical protein